MKKFPLFLFFLLAGFLPLAAETSFIPYHKQTDFFLYSPGSLSNGLPGHFNPASLTAITGGELIINGTVDISKTNDFTRAQTYEYLGLFTAIPNLSFSLVKPPDNGTSQLDYKLATGFGNKSFSLGLGFGWSSSSPGVFSDQNNFSFGLMVRPFPFLSWGLFGTRTFSGKEGELVTDFAVRPLGNNLLTVFGDYTFATPNYGFGLAAEVAKGIIIGGRIEPETPAFAFGLRISFGNTAIASQLHTQSESSGLQKPLLSLTARIGSNEPSLIRDAATNRRHYLLLEMKGTVTNRANNFFFQTGTSLLEILQLLDKAKTEQSLAALVINTSGLKADLTTLWEIKEKLKTLKMAGKKIIIFVDNADINLYQFASIADLIIIDPLGSITLSGYLSGSTFYKGLLDKAGLGVDELRCYQFKSAAESFTRKDFSENDRQQRQLLIDDRYELASNQICQARGFSKTEFDTIINQQYYVNAEKALELRLVDKIATRIDLETIIDEWLKQKNKCITAKELANLPSVDYDRWSEPPTIALVYAEGVCAMDTGIRARDLAPLIEQLGNNPTIAAIVLRINSPGGDAIASDLIAQTIKKVTKPVIISQGAVAASGGYWLSMYGDRIFSTPATLTGSIGVIFSYLYNTGLKEKLGLTTDNVQRGEHADLFFGLTFPFIDLTVPNRPLNDIEKKLFYTNLQSMYRTFVGNVATARHKNYEDIEAVANGHIWSGQSALKNGLVDEIGGLDQAISYAREKARIPGNIPIKIIEYPLQDFFPIGNLRGLLSAISNPGISGLNYFEYKQQRMSKILMENLQQRFAFNGIAAPLLPWDDWELTIND